MVIVDSRSFIGVDPLERMMVRLVDGRIVVLKHSVNPDLTLDYPRDPILDFVTHHVGTHVISINKNKSKFN